MNDSWFYPFSLSVVTKAVFMTKRLTHTATNTIAAMKMSEVDKFKVHCLVVGPLQER